ncbi:MAG: HU family DNA-binding protein [Patescibacteria group bacterium]
MNKAELAVRISDHLHLPKKTAEEIVALFEDIITSELVAGGEVTIAGFGTFSARRRAGRKGVNPQKPSESIDIPSVTVPKFKAGKALKDALKGKRKVAYTLE